MRFTISGSGIVIGLVTVEWLGRDSSNIGVFSTTIKQKYINCGKNTYNIELLKKEFFFWGGGGGGGGR